MQSRSNTTCNYPDKNRAERERERESPANATQHNRWHRQTRKQRGHTVQARTSAVEGLSFESKLFSNSPANANKCRSKSSRDRDILMHILLLQLPKLLHAAAAAAASTSRAVAHVQSTQVSMILRCQPNHHHSSKCNPQFARRGCTPLYTAEGMGGPS